MAEGQRMTTADVVAKVMAGEHGDFVREAVALIAHELMEAEISAEVGAELHEVSPQRITHRNGYRPRPWETRVGDIELLIPRKRQGPAYSRASWSRAGDQSRRSSPSCSRPMSTE
jgi:putative transposase